MQERIAFCRKPTCCWHFKGSGKTIICVSATIWHSAKPETLVVVPVDVAEVDADVLTVVVGEVKSHSWKLPS